MIGAAAGFLLPVAAVWLAIVALPLHSGSRSRAVIAAVAICIGLGVSSLTTTWLLALGMSIGRVFVAIDALLWTSIGAFAWWYDQRVTSGGRGRSVVMSTVPSRGLTTADWLVRGVFGIVAVAAVVSALSAFMAAPHGEWDSWAVWNQKARFLYLGDTGWRALFAIDWSNPGHPLLVPMTVARLWAYTGAESTIVPATVGVVFGGAIVSAVIGALDTRSARAWIAGSVLLAAGTFVQQVASQQADVPFACFLVATLIVLRDVAMSKREGHEGSRSLLLAGTLATLAAWTKNEGLVVVVGTASLVGWMALRDARPYRAAWWMVGAAPAMMTLVWFKLLVAPVAPGYLAEGSTGGLLLERFFGADRHAIVGALLWQYASAWGGPLANGVVLLGLVAATLVAVTRAGRSGRAMLGAVGVLISSYYVVYLQTSMEVEWLMMTTFDRLMVQIWPTLVLAAFLTQRESAPAAAAEAGGR